MFLTFTALVAKLNSHDDIYKREGGKYRALYNTELYVLGTKSEGRGHRGSQKPCILYPQCWV